MEDCIFCKIVKRKVPAKIEKETDNILVFHDIQPQAIVHLLIVPKKHIEDIRVADDAIWKDIKQIALSLAKDKDLSGFRLVNNTGDASIIKHLHVHFLGGVSDKRKL